MADAKAPAAMSGGVLRLGSYEVDMVDKIGQGSFGVVYRGKNTVKHFTVAAKQCDLKSEKAGSDAMVEIKHFQYLRHHPHIVRLHDFHYKDRAFWMIMEFCESGDLEHYFKAKVPDTKEQIDIMYQCASAIAYMHCQVNTVIHRDIKPGNLLMKMYDGHAVVKVTDFGLSKIVEAPDPAKTLLFTTKAGTPGFMAPEFFLSLKYEKSVDVFALGLVFLAMLTFQPGDAMLAPVAGGLLLPIGAQMAQLGQMNLPVPEFAKEAEDDSPVTKSLKNIITRMIKYFPKDRCPMRQAVVMLEDLGGSSPNKVPNAIPPHRASPNAAAPPKADKPPKDEAVKPPEHDETPQVPKSPETKTKEKGEASKKEANASAEAGSITDNNYKGSEAGGGEPGKEFLSKNEETVLESSDSDSEGDVGFRVMKRAVEQALKDRLEVGDDVIEGMRDLPFKELLAQCIRHDKAIDEFSVGDQVVVLEDKERVAQLQDGYGGWNKGMARYLGKYGLVKEKVVGRLLKVIHDDGQTLHYNPKALRKTGEKPYNPAQLKALGADKNHVRSIKQRFKRFDVVTLTEEREVVELLQEGHGGWNSKMQFALGVKGMVNRVDSDGDVFVEFIHGDDWTLNPEVILPCDMSGGVVEAGDFVIVVDDQRRARQLQRALGLWDDDLEDRLGRSGVVRAVTESTITVDMGRKSLKWHPDLIKLVAKGEEMLQAILKKNMKL